MSVPAKSRLIAIFEKRTPNKELFRVNQGRKLRLREWSAGRMFFDVRPTEAGMLQRKALQGGEYMGMFSTGRRRRERVARQK